MKEVIRCKRLNEPVFRKECPLLGDKLKESDDCLGCSFNPSLMDLKKNPVKAPATYPLKPKNKTKQEPWRAEACELPQNPFNEKQYKLIERIVKPIDGFDLRTKIKEATIKYLVLKNQFEGKPRKAKVRRDLMKIKELAWKLQDLLHNKVSDDALMALGDIWGKIYRYEDDVYKIYCRTLIELKDFPSDPGGARPWDTATQKSYFQNLADIYEQATCRKIKRSIDPVTGKPTKEYKKILDFFRLCWEIVNPENKKLSDGIIDSKIRYYLLNPSK